MSLPSLSKTVAESLPSPRYFTADACAARYGFSPEHWRRLVDAGKAPQPSRFGRLVRWPVATLDQWDASGNPPVSVRPGRRVR